MLNRRITIALMIAIAAACIPSISFASPGLYWAEDSGGSSRDGNTVSRSDLNFSNAINIHNFPDTTDYGVRDVAVDETRGKIYWSDIDQDNVSRSNLDGSQVEEVVTQLFDVRGIEIDPVENKLYFIQHGLIQRADADLLNSNVESLHLVVANTLSLDRANGKLYWSAPSDGRIQRSNLDGSSVEDVVTGLGRPLGVHVAPSIEKVFWTDNDTDSIGIASTTGLNQAVTLDLGIPNLRTPSDVDYDSSTGILYWVDSNRNFIQRAELQGTSVGSITTLSRVNPTRIDLVEAISDSDGDGLPDDQDACPSSDLQPFVIIDDCDSGVVNHLGGNGCSVLDEVWICADLAPNHGQFVACVARLANELARAGVIDGREKGAITSCAARSAIP